MQLQRLGGEPLYSTAVLLVCCKRLPPGFQPVSTSDPFFVLFVPFCGYSFFTGPPAANGTSALSHLAKLSFTDSGANSAMRLV